jgi:hypothetical protein
MLPKIALMFAASGWLALSGVSSADVATSKQPPDGASSAASDTLRLLGEPANLVQRDPDGTHRPRTPLQAALVTLGDRVERQSHPDALRFAFEAYYNYRTEHPEDVRKPYLYFVDYGLDSRTPRGYVFDMDRHVVVEGPFHVAHGRGSDRDGLIPTRFSNRRGSNATSLGLYLAEETYSFSGRSGGRSYRSIGLRLRGLSGEFNSAARERGIVVHGAPYVTDTGAGRSEGCPAMREELARELIPRIANGGVVFHFSPYDPSWMRSEPWVQSPDVRLASAGRPERGLVR